MAELALNNRILIIIGESAFYINYNKYPNFFNIVVECLGPGPGGGHGFRFGELQSRKQHTPITQLPIIIVLIIKQLLPISIF